MQIRSAFLALGILALFGAGAVRADDSEVARSIAEPLIKKRAIECLAGREFDVRDETFRGKVSAVEPEKRLQIKIEDFQFVSGRVLVSYRLESRFRFDGKVTTENSERDATGLADVGLRIELAAEYRDQSGSFDVDAQIIDIDKIEVQIVELKPADLLGGKEPAAKHVKTAVDEHVEDLILAADAWLAKHNKY